MSLRLPLLLALLFGSALAGGAPLGPASAAAQGSDGVFEERSSSHFRLLQDVGIDRSSGWNGSVRFEREVLETLEKGYDRLEALLGLRPERTITVVVYAPEVFDATFRGLFRFPAAGFYHGKIQVRGATAVTASLRGTLWHELVHAAFHAAAPTLVIPGWLNEGLAEWFEARQLGRRRLRAGQYEALRRAARQEALPRLEALATPGFGGLDPRRAGLAYLYSYGLMDFLARRHGERSMERLVTDLVRRGHLERSFERVFRGSPAALDAAFRAELRG